MSKIIIGKFEGKNFVLPRDTVTSTLVILGGKGMGKTNLGGVVVEEVNAQGDRWCVIDPLGVWWGLRHSLDGKGPGIECVILGGPHGDIPIEPTGGAVAADLVVDEQANVIIDISRKANGEMWGMGERIRFAKDFAKRLFQRQGELVNGQRREPIFVELDEAATFIPQSLPSGNFDIAECISAWQTLVEWGRNVGIGVGLLTQRSARINKSVTEVADALFAFRIVGPNSIKAVTDWLGEHVPKQKVMEHIETIRSLDRGRCLVVSPGWMKFEGVVDIRLRHTFDSSATPKPGERQKRVTGKAAKPDLTKYQERMKETIDRAKAEDPKELRKQVQELKGKLAAAEKSATRPVPTKSASAAKPDPNQARVLREMKSLIGDAVKIIAKINAIGFEGAEVKPEELQAALEKAAAEVGKIAAHKLAIKRRELENLKAEVNRLLTKLNSKLGDDALQISLNVVKNEPATVRPVQPIAPRVPREQRAPLPANGEVRSKLALQIAGILAAYYPDGLTRSILASMCGVTYGGHFSNNLSELRSAGLIEDRENSTVIATDKCAREYAGTFQPPTTTEEVIALWDSKLSLLARKILRKLVEIGGEPITRGELAGSLGVTYGGHFSNNLSELRGAGLIEDRSNGLVAANKQALFLNDHAA